MVAQRAGPATLSTEVRVAWTFRSGHVEGEEAVRMPLSTVQFAPPVDSENAAPAGRPATIPVTVTPQPDSAAAPNASLRVEASYDDGKTWTLAEHTGDAVILRHPAAPGYVSLRATAEDESGNTVEQTVIRAYKLA
jgi:hypothetical protein